MQSKSGAIARPVIGLCLIIVGALFLLGQIFNIGPFWPVLIVIPGGICLFFAVTGGRSGAPLAIPGMLVTGTGAILLYQSMTHNWQSWAYAWTLYPALLGAGMILMGRLTADSQVTREGRRFVIGGLSAFVILSALFEIGIFHSMVGGLAWPLLLIVLGLGVLWAGAQRKDSHA
jgi:hypothetical protein